MVFHEHYFCTSKYLPTKNIIFEILSWLKHEIPNVSGISETDKSQINPPHKRPDTFMVGLETIA